MQICLACNSLFMESSFLRMPCGHPMWQNCGQQAPSATNCKTDFPVVGGRAKPCYAVAVSAETSGLCLFRSYDRVVHWDFPHGKFGSFSPGKALCSAQPTLLAGWFSVSTILRTLTRTTESLTCAQPLMHAVAHGGVRTPEESLQ